MEETAENHEEEKRNRGSWRKNSGSLEGREEKEDDGRRE